ncbi:MAG: hypothetical protein ABIJ59_19455 [Pseudomonadota bacterium]
MRLKKVPFKKFLCFLKGPVVIASGFLIFGLSLFDTFIFPVNNCFAQDTITLLEPKEGALVISKKPEIQCRFSVKFLKQSIYISIDKIDMTVLAQITDNGFSLTPFHALPAGTHKLEVTFLDTDNAVHTKTYEFMTRHSTMFENISSTNKVSFIYSQVIDKFDDAEHRSISDWEVESNLNSQSRISEGPWELAFKTNARYTDQEHSPSDPVEKGLTLVDYMFEGKYDAGQMTYNAAMGDVSVQGTKNIISSLSRKGGTIGATSEHFSIQGFSLRTQQVYGLDGGLDLEPDTDDHLVGIKSGINAWEKRIELQMIYVTGGEKSNEASYGVWPEPGGTKGDAYGFELKTNFFDNKLQTLVGCDFSDYDDNTGDAAGSDSDKAYQAGINGVVGFFNYNVLYEYTGADYNVVTSSVTQDRKGITATTGLSSAVQAINFNFSQHNDNLDSKSTAPRIDTMEYGAAYNLMAISSMPISLGWQRSLQNSTLEPAGTSEIKNTTDRIFGSVSYLNGGWTMGLQPEYSQLDDETSIDYDTKSSSITLFSGYTAEKFSISPSISLNRFKDCSLGIEQDTVNYNLSFLLNIYKGLNFEGVGSYGVLDSSNNSVDQDNFNGDIQLSYQLEKPIAGIFSPKILVRASHSSTGDNVADTSSGETIVYLLISGSLDLSF